MQKIHPNKLLEIRQSMELLDTKFLFDALSIIGQHYIRLKQIELKNSYFNYPTKKLENTNEDHNNEVKKNILECTFAKDLLSFQMVSKKFYDIIFFNFKNNDTIQKVLTGNSF